MYVYILKSISDKTFYVGISKNPEKRLIDHNLGRSKYTKGHRPYRIIHKEICKNRIDARAKEKYYKSGSGREYIKKSIPL